MFIASRCLRENYVSPEKSQTNTTRKLVFHLRIALAGQTCCKLRTPHVAINKRAMPDGAVRQRIGRKNPVIGNDSAAMRNGEDLEGANRFLTYETR